MSEVWIVLGICIVVLLGAALPLLRQGKPVLPPAAKSESHDQRNKV